MGDCSMEQGERSAKRFSYLLSVKWAGERDALEIRGQRSENRGQISTKARGVVDFKLIMS